jgi:hypothetical protein
MRALLATAIVLFATNARAQAHEDYGPWRDPGPWSWELAAAPSIAIPYGGKGDLFSGFSISGGPRYLLEPPPRRWGGDLFERLGEGLLDALRLAAVGNQFGPDFRVSWLWTQTGTSYFGADVGYFASTVMPLADDIPLPPRLSATLGSIAPGFGWLVSNDGEVAAQVIIDIPVAVPMSKRVALEFRFTSRFIIGADELPSSSAGLSLGAVVRP